MPGTNPTAIAQIPAEIAAYHVSAYIIYGSEYRNSAESQNVGYIEHPKIFIFEALRYTCEKSDFFAAAFGLNNSFFGPEKHYQRNGDAGATHYRENYLISMNVLHAEAHSDAGQLFRGEVAVALCVNQPFLPVNPVSD